MYIALVVASLGFISQRTSSKDIFTNIALLTISVGSAIVNPAFVLMAKDLDVTVEQASYNTTTAILLSGIFPMFVVPFSNTYGRRVLYLVCFCDSSYNFPFRRALLGVDVVELVLLFC